MAANMPAAHLHLAGAYTCQLQWELEKREGVEARALGLDDTIEVFVNGKKWRSLRGPLTVTLNQD